MKKVLCGILLLAVLACFAPAALAETGKIGTAGYTFENGALTVTGGEFTLEQWQALIGINGQPINPGDIQSIAFKAGNNGQKAKLTGSASCMFYIPSAENRNVYAQLTRADLSGLDTSGVINMYGMFRDCSSLTVLDVSGFDTSNVTEMGDMFAGCSSLTSLDVSRFNTSNVVYMYSMFSGCTNLTALDVSRFNTSNVTNMRYMFNHCSSLTELDVSGFNTSNVMSMERMFCICSGLTSLDVSGFNTSNVTNMELMFEDCSSLKMLDVSGFNTSNVTEIAGIFSGCSSLTSLDVSGFNTSNVTNMRYMFSICSSLTELDVSGFDTSNVTGMSGMFSDCTNLTSLNLSSFNTSNVTDMIGIFSGCTNLTSLNLSSFNTSNVTDMGSMFGGCSSLTALDMSSFDTSNVTNMRSMFYDCSSLTELDVSSFNTAGVTDMSYMFSECTSLTKLDVSGFDTSNVTSMERMFWICSSLTELDLSSFTTSDTTNMAGMFDGCPAKVSVNEETWKGEKPGGHTPDTQSNDVKPIISRDWTLTLSPATLNDITATAGTAISPVTLTATLKEGMDTVLADRYSLAWSVSPALPNGLGFTNGTLSGTPTAVTPTANYTLTATATERTVSLAAEVSQDKTTTASVTVKITVNAPEPEAPTSDKGSGDETKKTTEEKAADVVKDLNTEATSVMEEKLNSNNSATKEAAQEVAANLYDSLSSEEISNLSPETIENAIENKEAEKADAEGYENDNNEVKETTVPAGTDLLSKSDNDSLQAAQDLSVAPKVVEPVAVKSEDVAEMKQTFANTTVDEKAGVDVELVALVKAAAGNLQPESAIEIEKPSNKLEDQVKKLESLILQVAEALIKAVNPKTQNKGMVVATALPKMTPKATGFFPMAVNLRNLTPGRKLMFWPSVEAFNSHAATTQSLVKVALADVNAAEESQEGKFFFLDKNKNPVSVVSGDASDMYVVPYLAEGTDYSTAFITADATSDDQTALQTLANEASGKGETDSPTSNKGGGGCDAGLGLAGMLALAANLPTLRKK